MHHRHGLVGSFVLFNHVKSCNCIHSLVFCFVFRWRFNVWRSTCLNEQSREIHHHLLKVLLYTYLINDIFLSFKKSFSLLFHDLFCFAFLSSVGIFLTFLLDFWTCRPKRLNVFTERAKVRHLSLLLSSGWVCYTLNLLCLDVSMKRTCVGHHCWIGFNHFVFIRPCKKHLEMRVVNLWVH